MLRDDITLCFSLSPPLPAPSLTQGRDLLGACSGSLTPRFQSPDRPSQRRASAWQRAPPSRSQTPAALRQRALEADGPQGRQLLSDACFAQVGVGRWEISALWMWEVPRALGVSGTFWKLWKRGKRKVRTVPGGLSLCLMWFCRNTIWFSGSVNNTCVEKRELPVLPYHTQISSTHLRLAENLQYSGLKSRGFHVTSKKRMGQNPTNPESEKLTTPNSSFLPCNICRERAFKVFLTYAFPNIYTHELNFLAAIFLFLKFATLCYSFI